MSVKLPQPEPARLDVDQFFRKQKPPLPTARASSPGAADMFLLVAKLSAGGRVCGGAVYFLNVRMYATSPLASASETPSDAFIKVLPSASFKPSLMALMPASSLRASWTLGSV